MNCYIDAAPPEILSEILLHVMDDLGDDIFLKWRLPLLLRRVSKRFHHITMNTCSLWRYLYIRHPLHSYLNNHIAHSGALSLEAHVAYIDDITPKAQVEITNLITQASQRLATLLLESLEDNKPITSILDQDFPVLERLDVKGSGRTRSAPNFPASRFPSLRSLRSVDFHSGASFNLPGTLEELHLLRGQPGLHDECAINSWSNLPKNIRVLRMQDVSWTGVVPSSEKKIHLPYLTELSIKENCERNTRSILWCLDAPCLEFLSMRSSNSPGVGLGSMGWYMDFPRLTHMEWLTWPDGPNMARVHQLCTSLKSLHIKLRKPSLRIRASVSHLVTTLADDQTFLPLLEDVVIRGASIDSLKSLARSRTRLTRLKVHKWGLGPGFRDWGAEKYMDWQEYETRSGIAAEMDTTD